MITCVCNNITENQVLCAIDDGGNTVELLLSRLSLGSKCKRCIVAAQELIDRRQDEQSKNAG